MKPPDNDATVAYQQFLERFFRGLTATGSSEEDLRTADFCFHMTDWLDDLRALSRLTERPGEADEEEWFRVVHGFLIHASGHIAAAAKLAQIEPVQFDVPHHADEPAHPAKH